MSLRSALAENDRGYKLLWIGMGVVTAAMLLATIVVSLEHDRANLQRWLLFVSASPRQGEQVFRDKGCAHCHVINSTGTSAGPDLGAGAPEAATLPQLVTAMWNHAPRMWETMRAADLPYPQLSYGEAAQLLSFLYRSRRADEPGDPARGRELFESKHCLRCHSIHGRGGKSGPDLSKTRYRNTSACTEAMLNRAASMHAHMEKLELEWPQFEPGELNDVMTYVQQSGAAETAANAQEIGDPDEGWEVYKSKSCLVCHSVKEDDGRLGPSLGPSTNLPPTGIGIAALMWNQFPKMHRAMRHRNIPAAFFRENELADLMAFLQSLRYLEPNGSPHLGQTVFTARGCGRCHGEDAEGTSLGPTLRGRGRIYNSVALAAALWEHGGSPYRKMQEAGFPWPILQESDIGDLLSFLNQPVKKARSSYYY